MSTIHRNTPRLGSSLKHGRAHAEDHRRWTRRDFMQRMSASGVATSFMLGNIPVQAYARHPMFSPLRDIETDKILVIIQLRGGNDGLNTVVPVTNDYYYQRRPRLAISAQDAIGLSTNYGLHPGLSDLEAVWGNGHLGIIHGVGYEDTTLSHFRSTDIWATGSDPNDFLGTGWMGRAFDTTYPNYALNPPEYPLAVQLGSSASVLLQGTSGSMGMQIVSDKVFERLADGGNLFDEDDVPNSIYGQELAFARTIANDSFEYAGIIHEALNTGSNSVDYPNEDPIGSRLAQIARMIKAGLPTHVYLATMIGYDTHSAQETRHGKLMEDLGASMGAFYNDLASSGDLDRVLVMTFSEFGRRVDENSSGGTDHGDAAPVFVMGGGVAGGFHGTEPDLGNVNGSGNMTYTSDFRSVYATVLKHWLEIDSDKVDSIFSDSFSTIPFIEGAPTDGGGGDGGDGGGDGGDGGGGDGGDGGGGDGGDGGGGDGGDGGGGDGGDGGGGDGGDGGGGDGGDGGGGDGGDGGDGGGGDGGGGGGGDGGGDGGGGDGGGGDGGDGDGGGGDGGGGDGGDGTTGTSTGRENVLGLRLNQNYPNPFTGRTRIDFELSAPSRTNISVYDTAGRLIKVLVNKQLSAGNHSVTFSANNLSSGIYICQMNTRMGTKMIRMVLVR